MKIDLAIYFYLPLPAMRHQTLCTLRYLIFNGTGTLLSMLVIFYNL
jgi:hypothetical protein